MDYLIVWTSLGQDGSREGVFGQFVHGSGTPVGGEFRVNTTTHQPADATGGGFGWRRASFWWFGRATPACRTVLICLPSVISMSRHCCSRWPRRLCMRPLRWMPTEFTSRNCRFPGRPLLGISVSNYEVYVDGASVPAGVTAGNIWTMTVTNGLAASSTHTFQVDYVTTAGQSHRFHHRQRHDLERRQLLSASRWNGWSNIMGIPSPTGLPMSMHRWPPAG